MNPFALLYNMRSALPGDHTTFATMASESLEERFKKAVWIIRNGPKMESTNEQKLTFYSYFKQVGRHALVYAFSKLTLEQASLLM